MRVMEAWGRVEVREQEYDNILPCRGQQSVLENSMKVRNLEERWKEILQSP